MHSPGTHPERTHPLNRAPTRATGRYVLYWMQASQRAENNPALDYAVDEANRLRCPVVVGFGWDAHYPEARLRHFTFMAEGLVETTASLRAHDIGVVLRRGSPPDVARRLARDAKLVVADRGYLRHQRAWRARLAAEAPCAVIEVEGDAVVPVETASDHVEFAARTLRPKLLRLRDPFLTRTETRVPVRTARGLDIESEPHTSTSLLLKGLPADERAPPTTILRGGLAAARQQLARFLHDDLPVFHAQRSDPAVDRGSRMSAYLHFGQISPVEIALAAREAGAPVQAVDAFWEELIVRRELALNYCWFHPDYDRYEGLPAWARRSLEAHARDRRAPIYTAEQLETANTDDVFWNAAQREMTQTGRMHGYMRMYWGKKILEWSRTPREAFDTALRLNNRYELDGRDPNGYAGVAWCFGLHDRPWATRPVFGQIRYMNAAGLERKFDMRSYLQRVRGG